MRIGLLCGTIGPHSAILIFLTCAAMKAAERCVDGVRGSGGRAACCLAWSANASGLSHNSSRANLSGFSMLWNSSNCWQPRSVRDSSQRGLKARANSAPLPGAALIETTRRTAISILPDAGWRVAGTGKTLAQGRAAATIMEGGLPDHRRRACVLAPDGLPRECITGYFRRV